MARKSKSQQAHEDRYQKMASVLSGAFQLGPKAASLLPALCDTFESNGWHHGIIDQVYSADVSTRSKGGAVANLQKAGVVVLKKADSCATIDNQKFAYLTAKSREVLRKAGVDVP